MLWRAVASRPCARSREQCALHLLQDVPPMALRRRRQTSGEPNQFWISSKQISDSRLEAFRNEMTRISYSFSVCTTETATPASMPSVTKRCSPQENRSSSNVNVRPSKTLPASRKSRPWALILAARFASDQVSSMRCLYIRYVITQAEPPSAVYRDTYQDLLEKLGAAR